jgi:hypothetical protein
MRNRYSGKASAVVFAALAAAAIMAPVAAQEGGWGSDAEDFSVQRPARMKPEADAGAADFGAALEAAAAAEGREAAPAEGGKKAEPAGPEFMPKNEITAIKSDKPDSAAGKPEKKEKAKKVKKKDDGEKMANTVGGRLGFGDVYGIGLGFGVGVSAAERVDVNMHFGYNSVAGIKTAAAEALAFYEWRVNISDELGWFFGPGAAVGMYAASKRVSKNDGKDTVDVAGFTIPIVGIGGRTGLEVDLSFIDPEHSLSSLRSSSISLDVRPVYYLWKVKDFDYPAFMFTVGISFNHVFGGGKEKK